jgi:UDP-N-acetylglucosamine--N-acetylmuramyl-(pentapeptide) pyrophosphoryl-undecaprenol N-acetylglucosamine transferase
MAAGSRSRKVGLRAALCAYHPDTPRVQATLPTAGGARKMGLGRQTAPARDAASRSRNGTSRIGTLLVASTGGHLSELVKLVPRLGLDGRPTWVTFKTDQSEVVLAGERTIFVRHTGPRDYLGVALNAPQAHRIFDRGVDRVVSTGAGIALSFLPLARARGIEAHYIESAARPDGPSLTGRLLTRVPGVCLYTQSPERADDRWKFAGSVFDGYAPGPRSVDLPRPLRVALTVGSVRFPFTRLVDRLLAILPDDVDVVLWQVGSTPSPNGRIPVRASVEPWHLMSAYASADVVVSHAGVGSTIEALDSGHLPIVVPRRARFREHVDDHQVPLAVDVARRGLAIHREADELTFADLLEAARSSVITVPRTPAFALRH